MLYPLSYGGGAIILPGRAAIGTSTAGLMHPRAACGLELGPSRANIRIEKTRKPVQER